MTTPAAWIQIQPSGSGELIAMPCHNFEGQPALGRSHPRMVVGFYFTPPSPLCEVLLIEKRRSRVPTHIGKLNGLGGGIEKDDESVAAAMSREFLEETGHLVPAERWRLEGTLCSYKKSDRWDLYILTATGSRFVPIDIEEGTLRWIPCARLAEHNVVPNLLWMIPMVLDRTNHGLSLNCHFSDPQEKELQ